MRALGVSRTGFASQWRGTRSRDPLRRLRRPFREVRSASALLSGCSASRHAAGCSPKRAIESFATRHHRVARRHRARGGDDPRARRRQSDPPRHLPRRLHHIRGCGQEGSPRRVRSHQPDARRATRALPHGAPQRFPAHLCRRRGRVPRYRRSHLCAHLRDGPAAPLVRRQAGAFLERHRQRVAFSDRQVDRHANACRTGVPPVQVDRLYRTSRRARDGLPRARSSMGSFPS